MKIHPLADTVPGEMTEEEFRAHKASIKKSGQLYKIVTYENMILDGRNRFRACTELGIKPQLEEFKGTKEEAAAYVVNVNLLRRQLGAMQKALVAARMATGKNAMTQEEASARTGANHKYVTLAVKMLAKGNEGLITRTAKGDTTYNEVMELLFDNGKPVPIEPVRAKGGSNVVPFPSQSSGSGNKAGKRTHTGHSATETTPSKLAKAFKNMDQVEKRHFVEISWQWLQPALIAAGKLTKEPAGSNTQAIQKLLGGSAKKTPKGKPAKRKAA